MASPPSRFFETALRVQPALVAPPTPDPSTERTPCSTLRVLAVAAHVKLAERPHFGDESLERYFRFSSVSVLQLERLKGR